MNKLSVHKELITVYQNKVQRFTERLSECVDAREETKVLMNEQIYREYQRERYELDIAYITFKLSFDLATKFMNNLVEGSTPSFEYGHSMVECTASSICYYSFYTARLDFTKKALKTKVKLKAREDLEMLHIIQTVSNSSDKLDLLRQKYQQELCDYCEALEHNYSADVQKMENGINDFKEAKSNNLHDYKDEIDVIEADFNDMIAEIQLSIFNRIALTIVSHYMLV